jgi:heptosyltransferase-3
MNLSSVLVISVARIGDTILLTPCLKAIKARHPEAVLSVLAHPKRMEVLQNLATIDHLGAISKHQAMWRGWLPGKAYDAALVYGRDAALVRYALRVARKVVCFDEPEFAAIEARNLVKISPPGAPIHAVHHRLMLLRAIGIAEVQDSRLSMCFTREEVVWADAFMAAQDLVGRHPLIGLQLFSFPAKAHRDWPIENFTAFIEKVRAHYPQALFVVLGDQLAAERASSLVEQFPEAVTVIAGQLTLRQSAAVMSRLDLYVGVDTGPTHIAGALGIPMVAMYHWKYPAANLRPLQNDRCRAIEHPATAHSDAGLPTGMEAITVDQVLDAALPLLGLAKDGAP